jgi:hypothetical protein
MIHNNHIRNGNFNSSEIVALMSQPTASLKKEGEIFGKAAYTFIEECNYERKLGRSISEESNARPLVWGKHLEGKVFDLLPMDYKLSSQETDVHPTINYWVGSKDGLKFGENKTVIDIKCPFTLKSFCQLVQPLYDGLTGIEAINKIRDTHKDGEKYYWQLVSNAIINDCTHAELIVYMPYLSELDEIKSSAEGVPELYFLSMASINELPYLIDNGFYKNINIVNFEVPQEDKDLLTERVLKAGKFLLNN